MALLNKINLYQINVVALPSNKTILVGYISAQPFDYGKDMAADPEVALLSLILGSIKSTVSMEYLDFC